MALSQVVKWDVALDRGWKGLLSAVAIIMFNKVFLKKIISFLINANDYSSLESYLWGYQ